MKTILAFFSVLLSLLCYSQNNVFTITYTTSPASCVKGSALLSVSGGVGSIQLQWEDGSFGVWKNGLEAGNYYILINDSAGNDTSITLVIDPQPCFLQGAPSFSPNGDGINDVWYIQDYRSKDGINLLKAGKVIVIKEREKTDEQEDPVLYASTKLSRNY